MKALRSHLFSLAVVVSVELVAAPPRPTPPPAHKFEITKVDLTGNAITVTNEHGEAKSYRLTNFTDIQVNNQRATIKELVTGMSVQVTTREPGVAERVTAANGVLGAGDAATKPAPAQSRVRIPSTSVFGNPVVIGSVKAGQIVTVVPIKVYWTGGGSKSGKYCDWNGYPGTNIKGSPWMAVVAAIGKEAHGPVNNVLKFTAAADGMLVIYANDGDPGGNEGSGEVTVTVE